MIRYTLSLLPPDLLRTLRCTECRNCLNGPIRSFFYAARFFVVLHALLPVPQQLVRGLLHNQTEASALPAATARACLPYWLEATGWAVALLSDATAAAMGRLPATKRTNSRSPLDQTVRGTLSTWGATHPVVHSGCVNGQLKQQA